MDNKLKNPAQPYEMHSNGFAAENNHPPRAWYNVEGNERALSNSGSINPFLLFQRMTGYFPDHRRYEGKLDTNLFLQKFSEKFPEAYQTGLYIRNYRNKHYVVEEATWWLGGCIIVSLRNFEFEKSILVLHCPDSNIAMLQAVSLLAENCPVQRSPQHIHLITHQYNDYQLRNFEIRAQEIDLDAHYNSGLSDLHRNLVNTLNNKDEKGIVMLHGKPGTGKTTYLRYLISVLDKKVIYLPPDMTDLIARPDFISFLLEHPGSVLVIEDAERIVEQRGKNSSTAISNLLNICDGLLADCLSIQVVCTFNMPLVNVDKALLRKGRLIAAFEFGELALDRTNRMMKELYGTTVSEPMTLANIYHFKTPDALIDGKMIGFR